MSAENVFDNSCVAYEVDLDGFCSIALRDAMDGTVRHSRIVLDNDSEILELLTDELPFWCFAVRFLLGSRGNFKTTVGERRLYAKTLSNGDVRVGYRRGNKAPRLTLARQALPKLVTELDNIHFIINQSAVPITFERILGVLVLYALENDRDEWPRLVRAMKADGIPTDELDALFDDTRRSRLLQKQVLRNCWAFSISGLAFEINRLSAHYALRSCLDNKFWQHEKTVHIFCNGFLE